MAKKVNFNLIEYPNQETALIVLRFHYKGKRFQISTGISIPVKYWNKNSQRVKATKDFPFYAQLNQRLNTLESDTLGLFYDYTAKGIVPTLAQFKTDWLAKTTGKPQKEEALEPIAFMDKFIQERKGVTKASSISGYTLCLLHLKEFEKQSKKPIKWESLTKAFAANFTAYLFAQGFTDAYSHRLTTALRTVVREAVNRELVQSPGLLKAKAGTKARSGDKVYLTEAEIKTLFDMELEGTLARVRDTFLLGCLTGLRFSDFSKIQPENIQPVVHKGKTVECLIVTAQKTGTKTVLPIVNPMLRAILERHGNKAPKAMSGQNLNIYIKELCQKAGFTDTIEISEFKGGSQIKKVVQKWEVISSHTARRTFATMAYKSGMPVGDIMRFTGHSTTASFMKYIRITTEEAAVYLAEHEFFTGKGK